MQELLKASKTETVGNQTYQCVPSPVMLTDGQTTDMLTGNYIKPAFDETSGDPTARGFVNDTGNKLRSFTGGTDSSAKKIGNFWDMFVEMANGSSGKYQSAAWYEGMPNKDKALKTPTGAALANMQKVATNYSDSIASMLLGTLMTTAYYKEAVRREYNVEDNWNIYTVSVDMVDPKDKPANAAQKAIDEDAIEPTTELPQSWKYAITSNPAAMDPSKYFYKDGKIDVGWLVDKGYVDKMSKDELAAALAGSDDVDVTGKTAYPDWSVGEMLIQGIVTAAKKLHDWGTAESGTGFTLNYQSWDSANGILKYKTEPDPKDPNKTVAVKDSDGNLQPDAADKWVAGTYVNP